MEIINNWPQAFSIVGIAACVTAIFIALIIGIGRN